MPRIFPFVSAAILALPRTSSLAATPPLPAEVRVELASYAGETWRSFEAMARPSGLPADALALESGRWTPVDYTSPTNIGAYLWSTLAAEDLQIIPADESRDRIRRTLLALGRLDRDRGFYFNWYDPRDGARLKAWPGGGAAIRPFLSTVDNAWLAAALMMVRNARPEFAGAADDLLRPMNFGFFHDPYDPAAPDAHPGLLRGGYWTDTQRFTGYHFGMLNSEARIASYIGIARGDLPPEHYYRLRRTRPPATSTGSTGRYLDVDVPQGYVEYRGLRVVPSWDGTMFEALMVPLFVPEADWAPRSWGINHPLYLRAQIGRAQDDPAPAPWGRSACAAPDGAYRIAGVADLSTKRLSGKGPRSSDSDRLIAPHASFLALPFARAEALNNLQILADRFGARTEYGFVSSVDIIDGRPADRILAVDQGMVMAALANALNGDRLAHAFSDGLVEQAIRPLIAAERFDSGRGPIATELAVDLTRSLPDKPEPVDDPTRINDAVATSALRREAKPRRPRTKTQRRDQLA